MSCARRLSSRKTPKKGKCGITDEWRFFAHYKYPTFLENQCEWAWSHSRWSSITFRKTS
jgi:hypothetical protein